MTAPVDLRELQRHIRLRLFWLLLRAFFIVVSLTVLMLVGLLTGLAGLLTRGGSSYIPPEVRELEAHYLGHNSWDGGHPTDPASGPRAARPERRGLARRDGARRFRPDCHR